MDHWGRGFITGTVTRYPVRRVISERVVDRKSSSFTAYTDVLPCIAVSGSIALAAADDKRRPSRMTQFRFRVALERNRTIAQTRSQSLIFLLLHWCRRFNFAKLRVLTNYTLCIPSQKNACEYPSPFACNRLKLIWQSRRNNAGVTQRCHDPPRLHIPPPEILFHHRHDSPCPLSLRDAVRNPLP